MTTSPTRHGEQATVASLAACLREALASLDLESLSGEGCARLAEQLAATEKACAAARVLAARRAVDCAAHRTRGFADANAWVARLSGTTSTQARQALDTAAALSRCPRTKESMLLGEVSLQQAEEIARTEREAPGTEARLVALAKDSDLSRLRDVARAERARVVDPAELLERQHRARHFRHFVDGLGMVRFSGALPPAEGLPLVARIEQAARAARRDARRAGRRPESFDAHAADALVALLKGSSGMTAGSSGWRTELVVVCDVNAYRRGHAHPGEPCHLLGGGPIPVTLAKELCDDAFLKAVLHDGVTISTVRHFGRHISAEVRTALDLGAPPTFDGAACVDCHRRFGLEYDHLDPLANNGATEFANLVPRCYADHQLKTERDRLAGRLGRRAKSFARAPQRASGPPSMVRRT